MHSLASRISSPLLLLVVSIGATPTFHSSQTTINYGDSCTLSWTSSAQDAYILGVGKVAGNGSIQVAPEGSTDYILVTHSDKNIEYTTIHINVAGLKGNELYPDPDDFHPGLREQKKADYTGFLDEVSKTLQDTFAYHVRGLHMPNDRFFLFYTNWVVKPTLILPTDRGIRHRQAAYAVQVNEPINGVLTFDVRTLVQYQRMGESEWRPDQDPTINRMAEKLLEDSLAK